MEEYFEEQQLEGKSQDVMSSKIKCLPLPGKYFHNKSMTREFNYYF